MQRIKELISNAEAIVIGLGSGMSSTNGKNHYHLTSEVDKHFHQYFKYYGTDSLMKLFLYPYASAEAQYAFYVKYVSYMLNSPCGESYLQLYKLVKDKNYHIITTNVDCEVEKIFPREKICFYQGSFEYLQCSQPCCDELFPVQDYLLPLEKDIKELKLNNEIPRCKYCFHRLIPWVNDDSFLRGEKFNNEVNIYHDFLRKNISKKILFIMLGVGEMTPSIIKLPFWKMVYDNDNAFLINVTLDKTTAPLHLQNKMINIIKDINEFLKELNDL